MPPGSAVATFDADLIVGTLNGEALDPELTLIKAMGAREAEAIVAAARRAVSGRDSTAIGTTEPEGTPIFVRLAPDPENPGGGIALWFEGAPADDADARQEERADELDVISAMSRELARSTDLGEARQTVCSAALTACAAGTVILFEPDRDANALKATAAIGLEAEDLVVPLNESSEGAEALRSNCQRLTSDTSDEPEGARAVLEAAGARSALWQPISRGRSVRAVMAICWEWPTEALNPRSSRLLEVIAVEAAVALDRGQAFDRLVSMASTDVLTGLPNRRAWREALAREVARASREGSELTVAMLDLDEFKAYNDTRGHQAGDRLLESVAVTWSANIRASDTLSRFGGDEFALVLPHCGGDRARQLISRLPQPPGGEVTFSAGAVSWNGFDDPDHLIGKADRALYEAKRAGPASLITIP